MLLSLSNIQYLSSYKPSPSSSSKYKFKVCIIGNSSVGKTSLIYRAKKNAFVQTLTTVGYDVIKLYFKLPNEEICELHLWDTCGQETYQAVNSIFYKDVTVGVLVYSITNKNSLEELTSWLNALRTHTYPDIKVYVLGNKADCAQKRKVSLKEGEEFVKENDLWKFTEISAKEDAKEGGVSVIDIFKEIIIELINDTNNINDIKSIKLINEDNDNEINKKVRTCTC